MLGKIFKGVGKFILRRGPIIAAGLVGLQSVPTIGHYVQYAVGLLGIFGVQPDPTVTAPAGDFVLQLSLLIGAIRKLWSLFQAFKANL